jgi:putative RNA 2'-phosphotransferase
VPNLLQVIHDQTGMDWVGLRDLEDLAEAGDRKRFEIQGERIRATYGHSFETPVRYEPVEPPELLYIGIPKARAVSARERGIRPEDRAYVHLSDQEGEAMEVARRQSPDAELVVIRAREAAAAGVAFHRPTAGLYLCLGIPPSHIEITQRFGRRNRKGRRR